MKFSIIIATFNAQKTLSKTLDSTLSQTFEDYEVIIDDNKSTDGTVELVKKYETKFRGKLKFLSEVDEGLYDAMNKGIDMSKGDWLYFLGSDDFFYNDEVLSSISDIVGSDKFDVVYGNVQLGKTKNTFDGKFSKYKLMLRNMCHQSIFYNRSVFDRLGKFDTNYKTAADYVFNMMWFNDKSMRFKYINTVIAVYDVNGFSSINRDTKFWTEKTAIMRRYFSPGFLILWHIRNTIRRIIMVVSYLLRGDVAGLRKKFKSKYHA